MLGIEIVMLVIGISFLVVVILYYNIGNPFDKCGRRTIVYAEN